MKKWIWIISVTLTLTVITLVVDFTMVEHHGEHWWSSIPAFYILFGFTASVALVHITGWLGKFFILSDKDYYDR